MLKSPVVSVIIPTFNRLPFLRCALGSVEGQTFLGFEVLVLDDGSTDGTYRFLEGYAPHFPFRWFSFQHQERSYLRNYGAHEARGEFLAFLDDDDEWLPEKLEKQVKFLEQNPDVGLVYTRTKVINSEGGLHKKTTALHKRLYDDQAKRGHRYSDLAYLTVMFTSTVMIRRSLLFNVGGYDEQYSAKEDLDLYLRCSLVSKIDCIGKEPLVYYRCHEGSSSNDLGDARIKVSQRHLRSIANTPEIDPEGKAKRAFLFNIAKYHYWAGRYSNAIEAIKRLAAESASYVLRPPHLLLVMKIIVRRGLCRLGEVGNEGKYAANRRP
jgi:glycosyltransferase involved in cell wall biosynthesis